MLSPKPNKQRQERHILQRVFTRTKTFEKTTKYASEMNAVVTETRPQMT